MTLRVKIALFVLMIPLISVAIKGSDGASAPGNAVVQVIGEVKVSLAGSKEPLKDASKVVVWLTRSNEPGRAETPTPQRYRMVQHNKMFEPRLLVIPIGSLVDFPNLDPWFHNVFSLYQGKRFDLGLYEAGAHKEIRFDREGVSYIFCNIHPEMAAVIMTVDSNWYGVSDKAGRVSIPNVPEGKYVLHVWHDNVSPQTLNALDRRVEIDPGAENLPTISVSVTSHAAEKHKNKYGRDYDPKAGSSDYNEN